MWQSMSSSLDLSENEVQIDGIMRELFHVPSWLRVQHKETMQDLHISSKESFDVGAIKIGNVL